MASAFQVPPDWKLQQTYRGDFVSTLLKYRSEWFIQLIEHLRVHLSSQVHSPTLSKTPGSHQLEFLLPPGSLWALPSRESRSEVTFKSPSRCQGGFQYSCSPWTSHHRVCSLRAEARFPPSSRQCGGWWWWWMLQLPVPGEGRRAEQPACGSIMTVKEILIPQQRHVYVKASYNTGGISPLCSKRISSSMCSFRRICRWRGRCPRAALPAVGGVCTAAMRLVAAGSQRCRGDKPQPPLDNTRLLGLEIITGLVQPCFKSFFFKLFLFYNRVLKIIIWPKLNKCSVSTSHIPPGRARKPHYCW